MSAWPPEFPWLVGDVEGGEQAGGRRGGRSRGCAARACRASSAAPAASGPAPGSATSRPRTARPPSPAGCGRGRRRRRPSRRTAGRCDSLKPSMRCGLRSNLRQIRPTVDSDRPLRLAIEARDQCVASRGSSSSVAVTTSSTLSSRIDGGRPGRFSSRSPPSRPDEPAPPPRHRCARWSAGPPRPALFSLPPAQASTIRARSASACDVFARRAHRASCSRSAPVSTRSAFRRPGRGASASPAVPDPVNRERHFRTVSTESPSSAAAPEFPSAESAHASTIRARSARRRSPERASRSSSARSSPDSASGATGSDMTTAYRLTTRTSGG